MKAITHHLIILIVLALSSSLLSTAAVAAKKERQIVGISGRISALKHGRDKKRKQFWEYKVKTNEGQTITVHDYKFGRYRQPASVGLSEGKKVNATGFYVNIRTKKGSDARTKVFIIPPK